MEILDITYLVVALGAGLMGWRFLQSTLKVQKLKGPTTMGFLFSAAFFLLALGNVALGVGEYSLAFLALGAMGAVSLNLARYILLPKLSPWKVLLPFGTAGIAGALVAATSSLPQLTSFFLFLLYAAALVPLFFVFHHFFVLTRDAETKEKSLGFLFLIPYITGSGFLALVLSPLFNIPAGIASVTTGSVGMIFLLLVVLPLFAKAKEISHKPAKATPKVAPPVLEFLEAF